MKSCTIGRIGRERMVTFEGNTSQDVELAPLGRGDIPLQQQFRFPISEESR